MLSYDFAYWLENNSFGIVGTNIFQSLQPLDPSNCITVFDVNAPNISESSSLSVDLFGIQVIVRNSDSNIARDTIRNIHKKFMGFGGSALINTSDDIVSMVFIDQPPYSLGKDNKNRQEYGVIYNLRVESQDNEYRL